MSAERPEVLFLCVHNAGRSQMAAAFARRLSQGRVVIHSAGSDPEEQLNLAVVRAMREVGIDITDQSPQRLSVDVGRRADVIVTMGCGAACPIYPGRRYIDWELPDPAGLSLAEIRPIRDEIERRVRDLVDDLLASDD